MQAKEGSSFLSHKMTRRQFVSSLALLGFFGASAEGTNYSTRNYLEIVSLNEFMRGFSLIDQEEHESLTGSVEAKKISIDENGYFNVADDLANVCIKFTGIPDSSVSLSILEATVDEDEDKIPFISDPKKYIIPLIESEELYDATLYLGNMDSGEHKLQLYPTKYTKEISQHILTDAYSISSSNPVMQTMIDLIPKLSPRNDVYKYQHIPNDIPLYTYAKIRKNKRDDYLVTYSFITSSEDGGFSPKKVLRDYGRTPDVEWIYMQKINVDGKPLERVFQAKNHQTGVMSSNLPAEFHVSTGNNMVARDLAGDKIVSLFPEFLSGSLGGNDIIKRYNALQVLSYRELLYERRMKLGDFSIQQFIKEHLGGINLLTFDLPWPPPVQ